MKLSVEGLDRIIVSIGDQPQAIARAAVRAMNRGIGSGRTVMVKAIAQDTGLSATAVREALVLRQASLPRPEASLAASLKRIPLIQFGARGPEPSRGKGRGVSYRLPGGAGRLTNAFIATLRSGHRGVFVRAVRKRLPIRELFGPSLGRVFLKYRADAQARVIEMFHKNFGHELAFESGGFVTAGPGEIGTPDEHDVAA